MYGVLQLHASNTPIKSALFRLIYYDYLNMLSRVVISDVLQTKNLLFQIKEIGHLCHNSGIIGATEHIFL